jgi:hypothetical protein
MRYDDSVRCLDLLHTPPHHRLGWSWTVRGSWDGAIGIHWTVAIERGSVNLVVDEVLKDLLPGAAEILSMLKPSGPRYLHIIVRLGDVGRVYTGFVESQPAPDPITIRRGRLAPNGGWNEVRAGIKRELERAIGLMAYENPAP